MNLKHPSNIYLDCLSISLDDGYQTLDFSYRDKIAKILQIFLKIQTWKKICTIQTIYMYQSSIWLGEEPSSMIIILQSLVLKRERGVWRILR